MNETEKLARIFKVLSVETRVEMINLLKDRTLCVNAMARMLEVSPAAVSQHLRILRDADIVKADKKGYFVHYSINNEKLAEWGQMTHGLFDSNAFGKEGSDDE